MLSMGERLREERIKLKLTQSQMAKLGSTTKASQIDYEKGNSSPKGTYLEAAARVGIDVLYVITGQRNPDQFSQEEVDVIGFWRLASLPAKAAAWGALRSAHNMQSNPHPPTAVGSVGQISGTGAIGIQATGDIHTGSGDIIRTEQHIKKIVAKTDPGGEHITPEQRRALQVLVTEIVETEGRLKRTPNTFKAVWSALNRHCKVSSYTLIRVEDFGKAKKYLNMWLGRLNSSKRASTKNADAWRNKKYAYIKINSKENDIESQAIKNYLKKNFDTSSLTKLTNSELEQVYRYVAGRRATRQHTY